MPHTDHDAGSAGGKGEVLPKFELTRQINWLGVRISLLTDFFFFFFCDNLVINCIFSQCKDC